MLFNLVIIHNKDLSYITYVYGLFFSSFAEEARRHQQKICRHVELFCVIVGAGDQRSPLCWPLTHGDRHESKWAQCLSACALKHFLEMQSENTQIPQLCGFLCLRYLMRLCTWTRLHEQVALEGLRPTIPPGISPHICKLMRLCMNEDPAKRPKFDMIVPILEKMQDKWTL